MGEWKKGRDDVWRHRIAYIDSYHRSRSRWVAETAVGHVFSVRGSRLEDRGLCPECSGTTRTFCRLCGGEGEVECPRCKGDFVEPDPESKTDCTWCTDGIIPCNVCGGDGVVQEGSVVPTGPLIKDGETKRDPNAIYLKNGGTVRGTVVLRTKDAIVVKTAEGSITSISLSDVESLPGDPKRGGEKPNPRPAE